MPLQYVILKLGLPASYSIGQWSAAHWAVPANTQNSANCDAANKMSNRIHVSAN
jgi:hypothetical protein